MAAAGGPARGAMGSFLFGNVDESGALEEDAFADAEVREALQRLAASRDDALGGVLEGVLGDAGPDAGPGDGPAVEPARAAVDYSGIEEAAPETKACDAAYMRLTRDGRYIRHSAFFAPPGPRRRRLRALRLKRRRGGARPLQWGDDEHAELRGGPPASRPMASLRVASLLNAEGASELSPRERAVADALQSCGIHVRPSAGDGKKKPAQAEAQLRVFDVYAWEENVALDDDAAAAVVRRLGRLVPLFAAPSALLGARPDGRPGLRPSAVPRSAAGRIVNRVLLSGDWAERVVCADACVVPRVTPELPLDDPFLLLDAVPPQSTLHPTPVPPKKGKRVRYERIQLDRLNVSSDRAAGGAGTPAGGSSSRVRLGRPRKAAESRPLPAPVSAPPAHSSLALRLAAPHFAIAWGASSARRWHRPQLRVSPGTRVVVAPSAVAPGAAPSLLPAVARTAAPAVLVEHCEEHPPLLLNAGMGANIATRPVDGRAPAHAIGALRSDAVSLLGDAEVPPGGAALSCALFRAPLFVHAVPCVLLLVRAHVKGAPCATWHVRPLSSVAVAGQTFPVAEAMHPHSRRLNGFARARVQAMAYRLFRRDLRVRVMSGGQQSLGDAAKAKSEANQTAPNSKPQSSNSSSNSAQPMLRIQRIVDAFPQWSSATIRKWMREYAEPVARGSGPAGAWRLRPDAPAMSEDELRALVGPEAVCAYEGMVAGEQRLADVGLGPRAGADAALAAAAGLFPRTVARRERSSPADAVFEEWRTRMAPWTLASNCVAASAGRVALSVLGDGDPSGRGEAVSLVRAGGPSPTDASAGRADILRVLAKQAEVLSAREPPSPDSDGAAGQVPAFKPTRVLRITRTFATPAGATRTETETVDDPRLILAYLCARRSADRGPKRKAPAPQAASKAPRPEGGPQPAAKRAKKLSFLESLAPGALARYRAFQGALEAAHDAVFARDPAAKPFLRPVSRTAYPAYHVLVARPMDLGTVRGRIRRGHYRRAADLLADYALVRDNCVQYNREDHPFSAAISALVERARDALDAPDVRAAERAYLAAAGLLDEAPSPPGGASSPHADVSVADVLGV